MNSISSEYVKQPDGTFKSADFCSGCRKAGKEHRIINCASGSTTSRSMWGAGVATHKRKCTSCGFEDGPWVSAEDVGGCW